MSTREEELGREICEIEVCLNEDNKEKYEDLIHERRQFEDDRIQHLIVRSRAQWHEEGEKSNKYFLNLLKRNAKKTQIGRIKVNGRFIKDQVKIRKEFQAFY